MSRWLETVRGIELCLMCGEPFDGEVRWSWMLGIGEERKLCGQCEKQLELIEELSCLECGRPKLEEVITSLELTALCSDCVRWQDHPPWNQHSFQHRAIYRYNPFLQEIIAQLKYRGDTELARIFHKRLKRLAGKLGFFHYVTPIPLNDKRQWERGFNQAAVLASCFPTTQLLVRAETRSEKQSKRTRRERLEALEGVFSLACEPKMLAGKSILLVDDIYTTGATLRSAASVLYDGGAKKVSAVTIGRAVGTVLMKS